MRACCGATTMVPKKRGELEREDTSPWCLCACNGMGVGYQRSGGLDEASLDITDCVQQRLAKAINQVCVCVCVSVCVCLCLSVCLPVCLCLSVSASVLVQTSLICSLLSFPPQSRDKMAAAIVNEMRARIHSATALTASAGIACTRRLAKICSGVFVSVSVCVNISLDLSLSRPLSTSLDLSRPLSHSLSFQHLTDSLCLPQ